MDLAANPDFDEHEEVVLVARRASGFAAIVAVHSTVLGPSMGGCRIKPYGGFDDALSDSLRLSRAMTLKNSLAGLDFGGGKAVIHRFDERARTEVFETFGEAVERLGGRYVTAQDVGASLADMAAAARRTSYVSGVPGQTDSAGAEPGPWTGLGVFLCIEQLLGDVRGKRVAIQGAGSVGFELARLLAEAGARIVVADVDAARAESARRLGADIAPSETIHALDADVFAPCALGGVLNADAIAELGAPVVCGAANNQLATEADGARLLARGVTYAPDYLVNAGGIICAAAQYLGEDRAAVEARVRLIPGRLAEALAAARADNEPPHQAAERMARARLEAAAQRKRNRQ